MALSPQDSLDLDGRSWHVFFASGWGSQFIHVVPDLDVVIVTTGGNQFNGKTFAIDGVLVRRLLHLLAIGFVVLQAWAGEICPLTTWEMALRSRGGQATYDSSFIAYWLGRLIYYEAPPWVFVVIYTLFAALVVATLFWVKPKRFGRLDEGT